MPKVVDPQTRRAAVVAALFRVVIKAGLQHASLRNVADEAGLNLGSLRHYFASHQELMRFAMQAMLDRVTARMEHQMSAVPGNRSRAERRTLVVTLLEELLPLDDTRRAEVTVWIEFSLAARTNPALAVLARESAIATRALIAKMINRMAQAGDLPPGLDIDAETQRLASLVDGLSLNAILYPDLITPTHCTRVLHAHLDQLHHTTTGQPDPTGQV